MIFEFYWSWYEDYEFYLFEHNSKTKKEFEQDCKQIMMDCFDNYMNSLDDEFEWAGLNRCEEISRQKKPFKECANTTQN